MKFHEAIVQALVIQAKGLEAEIIGMQTGNRACEWNGTSADYAESDYKEKAQQLFAISNEIQSIARDGNLA